MALMSGQDCPVEQSVVMQAVQKCPFLRNIEKPTAFGLASFKAPAPTFLRGPIFEDGPSFDAMFRIFHGRGGVVPLTDAGSAEGRRSHEPSDVPSAVSVRYHPLASSAASISLSAFGGGGPFSFDAFMGKGKAKNLKQKKPSEKKPADSERTSNAAQPHEALGSEWLASGNCPIAKSYRAVSGVLPLVAKMLQPPAGFKYKCPPAIVAARAALARTPAVKSLRPQALPTKVLAIGALGMAVNIPLGVWREHTQKFSPSWFVAVHASVPFVAMLRKAVIMPKYAMIFTIASAILGQVIGSRAERIRIAAQKVALQGSIQVSNVQTALGTTVAGTAFSATISTHQEPSISAAGAELVQSPPAASTGGHALFSDRQLLAVEQWVKSGEIVMPQAVSEGLELSNSAGQHGGAVEDVGTEYRPSVNGRGQEPNRQLVLQPSHTCGQEAWAVHSRSCIEPPAGSAIY